MGEEHHIRWTSRVPPLVVVVSVLIHLEFTPRFTSSPLFFPDNLVSLILLRSSSSGCCFQTWLIAYFSILIWKKRKERKTLPHRQTPPPSLCVAVFSGTCTAPLPREETHASTRVRPKLSMTTWVHAPASVRTSSWPCWAAAAGMLAGDYSYRDVLLSQYQAKASHTNIWSSTPVETLGIYSLNMALHIAYLEFNWLKISCYISKH